MALIALFLTDLVYSFAHPNQGEGITTPTDNKIEQEKGSGEALALILR